MSNKTLKELFDPALIESLTVFNEELNKTLFSFNNSILGASKKYKEIMLPLTLDINRYSKGLKEALAPLNEFQERFNNININWTEILRKASEKHIKLADVRRRLRDEKIAITPYLGEFSAQYILNELNDYEDSLIDFYQDLFSKENHIKGILTSWTKLEIYKKRVTILDRALRAHLEKDYMVSIPLFIAMIEGILINVLGKGFKNVLRTSYRQGHFSGELNILYDVIVKEIFRKFEKPPEEWDAINVSRHLIQHGKDLDYYKNRYASVRLLMVVDHLQLFKPSYS